jgi:hypothetical protein
MRIGTICLVRFRILFSSTLRLPASLAGLETARVGTARSVAVPSQLRSTSLRGNSQGKGRGVPVAISNNSVRGFFARIAPHTLPRLTCAYITRSDGSVRGTASGMPRSFCCYTLAVTFINAPPSLSSSQLLCLSLVESNKHPGQNLGYTEFYFAGLY